jgi:transposase
MARYIEGRDRHQSFLLPKGLIDHVYADNPIRVIGTFVDELAPRCARPKRAVPRRHRAPGPHPAVPLKPYIYGYLNNIPSTRRLERQAQRNVELIWLTGRLARDFKTIADFHRDNGRAIVAMCR